MKQIVLFVTLTLITMYCEAGVYKCTKAGETVYSEEPCAKDSKLLNLQSKEPTVGDLSSAQAKLKSQSRNYDVAKIEREIRGYKDDMDHDLSGLRDQQTQASNNIAGATWLQSISAEMSAVTSKYQLKIQEAQHRLDAINSSK